MDHGFGHGGYNLGSAAFWIFIAAAVVIGKWQESRREAERHETLRRIMEKTGAIDEARLKELFAPAKTSQWLLQSAPGGSYRGLRVGGTIIMFLAAGLAAFFQILAQAGAIPQNAATIGLASTGVVALLGVGLFFASRFVRPPSTGSRDEPPAR